MSVGTWKLYLSQERRYKAVVTKFERGILNYFILNIVVIVYWRRNVPGTPVVDCGEVRSISLVAKHSGVAL
jgi:hypothetical protein